MVAHAFSPSTWEAEAGDFWVRGQPGLQGEFQNSQGYAEKPCLKKQTTDKQKYLNLLLNVKVGEQERKGIGLVVLNF